jgi:flagellar biosynthesis/type III secretory pathway protein FliH
MVNTDGKKKQGRFLKKNSRLINSIDLQSFSFEEIANSPTIHPDNPERSIVHARYHDAAELKNNVKDHQTFNETINDANHPQMPIIFPQDFTEDWKNERLNAKRRSLGYEDDDDMDEQVFSNPPTPTPEPQASAEPVSPASLHEHGDTSEEAMNRAIKVVSTIEASRPAEEPAQVNDEPIETLSAKAEDPFIPLETKRPALAAEDRAMERYRLRHEISKDNDETLEQLKAEARAEAEQEGYKAGFQAGEEKGALTARAEATELFSKVNDIIKEFSQLKHNILNNVQKNFYELNQAIGEALLEREFSISPDVFVKIVRKAIADTVAPNDFKIKVHPKTFDLLAKFDAKDILQHASKDLSVQAGEFKIESNLTIVDVNSKKLIKQMLDSADTELFEHNEAS